VATVAFLYLFVLHGTSAQFDPKNQKSKECPYDCKDYAPGQVSVYYQAPDTFDREIWFWQWGSFSFCEQSGPPRL
jgi:hypothetical protein